MLEQGLCGDQTEDPRSSCHNSLAQDLEPCLCALAGGRELDRGQRARERTAAFGKRHRGDDSGGKGGPLILACSCRCTLVGHVAFELARLVKIVKWKERRSKAGRHNLRVKCTRKETENAGDEVGDELIQWRVEAI